MKKTILTTVIALFCFSASAQLRVMSNIDQPAESESWAVENFTNNIGVGYDLSDRVMIGVQQNGDDYDFIGRYNLTSNLYLSAQMPTEDAVENITMGVGFSMRIWNSLYVEPNYTNKGEEGSFNVGLSYKL
jgi:hypothetical protein|tara:strand:+ start:901 stop:1293 length:393 start_codon:yes stop_codon:yes gene_type:complete